MLGALHSWGKRREALESGGKGQACNGALFILEMDPEGHYFKIAKA